jgi:hypothetical protein
MMESINRGTQNMRMTTEQMKVRIAELEVQRKRSWLGGHDGTCEMNRAQKLADKRSRKKKGKRRRGRVAAGTPRSRSSNSVTAKFVSGGLPSLGKNQ